MGCPFSLAATLIWYAKQLRAVGLGDVPVVIGGIIPPEDARALRQMGIARVYTPKDFKITEIMGDVVGIVEKAWLVEG